MIKSYAKKIMAFAYNKTQDIQLAEDLSQEILLSLSTSLRHQEEIYNLNSFVYKICLFTWSKFLRDNKKHWNNFDIDAFFDLQDESNLEKDLVNQLLIEKLQVEIAYLIKLHRKITVMFYFENKTSNEISALLNIPHSTVRWHLSEIKKKLKVGIEMDSNNLSYTPQSLMAGHDGYIGSEYKQCGLGFDRLVDNICLACYGKALTLEEIARTLMVAAGYIENHIKRLVYMDYLRVVDKSKYTTNFFITTYRHKVLLGKYHYHNIGPYAKKIYTAFDKRYDQIKAIGFLGSDLDKDFVLWALIPIVVNTLPYKALNNILQKNNLHLERPKRKDGSEHWVCATLVDETYYETQTEFTREEVDFNWKSTGSTKTRSDKLGNSSLQLDSEATRGIGILWRDFDAPNLSEIQRIAQIIRDNETPNELDKLIIAREAELGYVKMVEGKPKMLIPYFNKTEFDKFSAILSEINAELGEDLFIEYIENFAKMFAKEIPDFIPKEETIFHQYHFYPQFAVLYWLADNNLLRYPSDEEAKRLCTVVWSTK